MTYLVIDRRDWHAVADSTSQDDAPTSACGLATACGDHFAVVPDLASVAATAWRGYDD